MFIIITDAHLHQDGPEVEEFSQMLEALANTKADIVFLGDIMELWVALPRYETQLHKDFVVWCRQQRPYRKIYFLEGNHEFFVSQTYANVFTATNYHRLILDNQYFEHGQLAQGSSWDINHFTQWLFRTTFSRLFIRLLPWGESFIAWLKKKLGSHGRFKTPVIPVEQLAIWGRRQVASFPQITHLLLGHFHGSATIPITEQVECRILPPWKKSHCITLLEPETKNICTSHWKNIISLLQ